MRRALYCLIALAFLLGGVALAREIQQQDHDANGFRIYNSHAPTQATDVVRTQDVAPGLCIEKSPGANTLPLVCAADGTDYLSPATGVAIAGHSALSVLGRSANSTGAIADIAGTNGQVLGISSSTLAFQTMTPASAGTTATWSLTGVQVFCLDTSAGNDANAGTAFSTDTTAGNVQTASATCGAVAKKTLAGMMAVIPPVGAGRIAYVLINNPGGTSGTVVAEDASLLDMVKGYTSFIVRATGTASSAGATAFSGSTADLIMLGAQTGAGMNVSGYNPASNVTTDTLQLMKVGGGSPAFSAEPAKPLGLRFRCDAATTTSADRNKVWMIVERTAADTIRLDSSATFVTSDVCYIEQPGVVFTPASAATARFNGGNSNTTLTGIGFGVGVALQTGRMTFNFTSATGIFSANNPTILTFTNTSAAFAGGGTVGPTRTESSVLVTNGNLTTSSNSLVTGTTFGATNVSSMSFLTHNVVGTTATITGGAFASQQLPGSAQQFGATGGNGQTTDKANAVRVLGQLIFRGARLSLGVINLPSTSQANAVVIYGTNDLDFMFALFGGPVTDAAFDISQSTGSRIKLIAPWADVNNCPHITGTNGDVYGGTTPTIGSVNIYATFAGLTQNAGVLILPNGDQWITTRGPSFSASQSYSYNTTVSQAVGAENRSGSDIPVNAAGCGVLVRFGPLGPILTDRVEIAVAQADSIAHASGGIGQAVGAIKNNTSGYVVVTSGAMNYVGSDPSSGGFGEGLLWLSDTQPGQVTHFAPVPPSVALRVGWSIGETQMVLIPDNQPIDPTLDTSTGVFRRAAITGDASVPAGSNVLTLATVVSAASCTYCSATFDAKGRATAFSSGATPALASRNLTAGAGMTGGGDLSADRTFDVVANADGTIVVNANDIQVGVINTANIAANAVTSAKFRQGVGESVVGVPGGSTANVQDIQATGNGQCLQTVAGSVVWATCSSGSVSSVSGTVPIVCSPSSPNPTCSLQFDNASITLNGGNAIQRAALGGDLTCSAGSNTCAVANLPNGVTQAGKLVATAIVAPATPSAGTAACYVDSTSLNLACKNASGVVNHGVQTAAVVSNQFVTAIDADGTVHQAQATYSGLGGGVPAITSLTGPITATGPGAAATSVTANAITDPMLRQGGQFTVIGRSAVTTGNVADIQAAGNGDILRVASNVLGFGKIPASSITSWCAAGDVVSSTGTAPACDPLFTFNAAGDEQLVFGPTAFAGWDNTTGGNAEFVTAGWTSNVFKLQSQKFGAGTLRKIEVDAGTAGFGFTETSGPTMLVVGSIPDSNPDATLIVRPAGAATVVGASTATLHTYTARSSLTYNLSVGVHGLASSDWLLTGALNTGADGLGFTTWEYSKDFVARGVTLTVNVINNTSSIDLTFSVTRNGTVIPGAAITISSATISGSFDTGDIASAGSAAIDTYGLKFTNGGAISATGIFTGAIDVEIYR